jgi:hypothetical protein
MYIAHNLCDDDDDVDDYLEVKMEGNIFWDDTKTVNDMSTLRNNWHTKKGYWFVVFSL